MSVREKLINKTAKVGVIGLGYVGLPLAVEIAKAGYTVLGFDIQESKVNKIKHGESYIRDIIPQDLVKIVHDEHLSATTNLKRIGECDVIIICVPTPLDKFKQPNLSYVKDATKAISNSMHEDMLIILESTTFPGTTEEVVKPILEQTGLKVGIDFYLVFSPERVDPGNVAYKTYNTPKVVGGCTQKCAEVAKILYNNVLAASIFTVSSPKEAEAAKILENTFRIVNCALANEMAIIYQKMGINIWEVIAAASTKPFGYIPFYPGPGVGGHCIPLDPFYLTYKAREFYYHTKLIELAGEINDNMPDYVVDRLMNILNEREMTLKNSRVLLLGIAYKGDIDDLRESPALKVWELLENKGANVIYHDPYCVSVKWKGNIVNSTELSPSLIRSCDVIVITTMHKQRINYRMVLDNATLIFDTKNAIETILGNTGKHFINLFRL